MTGYLIPSIPALRQGSGWPSEGLVFPLLSFVFTLCFLLHPLKSPPLSLCVCRRRRPEPASRAPCCRLPSLPRGKSGVCPEYLLLCLEAWGVENTG